MNENTRRGIHWSFWLIGSIALVWNGLGVVNYVVQMNPEMIDGYRASERAIIEGRPAWATAAFATAVFGGAIGSLLLLLRMPAASYVFIASLIGVVVTMIHTLGVDIDFGAGEIAGIIIMPLAVAALLVWYANFARRQSWMR